MDRHHNRQAQKIAGPSRRPIQRIFVVCGLAACAIAVPGMTPPTPALAADVLTIQDQAGGGGHNVPNPSPKGHSAPPSQGADKNNQHQQQPNQGPNGDNLGGRNQGPGCRYRNQTIELIV